MKYLYLDEDELRGGGELIKFLSSHKKWWDCIDSFYAESHREFSLYDRGKYDFGKDRIRFYEFQSGCRVGELLNKYCNFNVEKDDYVVVMENDWNEIDVLIETADRFVRFYWEAAD